MFNVFLCWIFQRKEPGPESKKTMILWNRTGMSQALRDVSVAVHVKYVI